jgi:deazaflavin-dependent oxidoreductase (nitroreductase family)
VDSTRAETAKPEGDALGTGAGPDGSEPVLVTGGSGYVGSHVVAELTRTGHRPRLLVRDPGKAGDVLRRLGVAPEDVDFFLGDMTNPESVDEALRGCNGVIHAAAALRPDHRHQRLVDVNLDGTRNVVGGAVKHRSASIVYVSTVAVFVPSASPLIAVDDPLARARSDYGRSKVLAEGYVRSLQDAGAPIRIVYPGAVIGPDQPGVAAMMQGLVSGRKHLWTCPPGGVGLLDVRDLAVAIVRALDPCLVRPRLMLGGEFVSWEGLADLCDELTGVRCRRARVPAELFMFLGQVMDAIKRGVPIDFPLSRDVAELMTKLVPTDDGPSLNALDLTLRPLRTTVGDSLAWLGTEGYLSRSQIGQVGSSTSTADLDAWWNAVSTVRDGLYWRAVKPLAQRMSGSRWFRRVGPTILPHLDRTVYRATGGRVLMGQALLPSLLLTSTGSRSGLPRPTPLACLPDPIGFLVVGSNFGNPGHPAWSSNLIHKPEAMVSYRGMEMSVVAELLDGADREAVWPRLLEVWPVYQQYADVSGRQLRVFRLRPDGLVGPRPARLNAGNSRARVASNASRGATRTSRLAKVVGGKVVVLTGASSGIGEATTRRLAAAGATVVAVARSKDRLETITEECAGLAGTVEPFPVDLADPVAVDRLASEVLDRFGQVDVLINNAGKSIRRSVAASTDRFHDVERCLDVNYLGPARLTLALLPSMRRLGHSHIVNVSSVGVRFQPPRYSAYVGSKAAFDYWLRSVAAEARGDGVAFTSMYFGLVRTEMIRPTPFSRFLPSLSAQEAGLKVCRALIDRPRTTGPLYGRILEIEYSLWPSAVEAVFNRIYRTTTDSARSRGLSEPQQSGAIPSVRSGQSRSDLPGSRRGRQSRPEENSHA